MAKVTKFIEADEEGISLDEWHAVVSYPYPRTVCGLQLEGEDGERHLPEVEGRVTCGTCLREIEQIKSIRNWKPRLTKRAPDKGGRRL